MPGSAWSPPDKIQQSRREAGQRQQVEPVVFEHGTERPGIARANELEVPGRNLSSRHVTRPTRTEDRIFQGLERTGSMCGAIAPETA
jgi:hypothetical protein